MRIVVRNARPDDAEALVRIHADASAYYAALDRPAQGTLKTFQAW
jgi:hypothetical protein